MSIPITPDQQQTQAREASAIAALIEAGLAIDALIEQHGLAMLEAGATHHDVAQAVTGLQIDEQDLEAIVAGMQTIGVFF